MSHECACGCGRYISYRKTPREKLYYSKACRQRAYRARNKFKHDLARIRREAEERMLNAIHQAVRRETWQDELAMKDSILEMMSQFQEITERKLEEAELHSKVLELELYGLRNQLAEKEAEIVRLSTLLEGQSKRKK